MRISIIFLLSGILLNGCNTFQPVSGVYCGSNISDKSCIEFNFEKSTYKSKALGIQANMKKISKWKFQLYNIEGRKSFTIEVKDKKKIGMHMSKGLPELIYIRKSN